MKIQNPSILLLGVGLLFVFIAIAWNVNWKAAGIPWLPIVISSFSFVVAAFTLWSTRLSPFELGVEAAGQIYLTRDKPVLDPLIKLQLVFSNIGAKAGFVSDVAIEIKRMNTDSPTKIWVGKAEALPQSLYYGPMVNVPPPLLVPFGGFFLKGGESVTKTLGFALLNGYDGIDQGTFDYELGEYRVTVLTKGGADSTWKKWLTLDFSIDNTDLQALARPIVPAGGGMVIVGEQIKLTKDREKSLRELVRTPL
jgi:hypothetical protein